MRWCEINSVFLHLIADVLRQYIHAPTCVSSWNAACCWEESWNLQVKASYRTLVDWIYTNVRPKGKFFKCCAASWYTRTFYSASKEVCHHKPAVAIVILQAVNTHAAFRKEGMNRTLLKTILYWITHNQWCSWRTAQHVICWLLSRKPMLKPSHQNKSLKDDL